MKSTRSRRPRGGDGGDTVLLAQMLWNALFAVLFVLLMVYVALGTTVVLYISFGVLVFVVVGGIWIYRLHDDIDSRQRYRGVREE